MGRVTNNGNVEIEEHIAEPPDHRPKAEKGLRSTISNVRGEQVDGVTTLYFSAELDSEEDAGTALQSGQLYHVTFAWSHEDDFYHHSAQRSALDLEL